MIKVLFMLISSVLFLSCGSGPGGSDSPSNSIKDFTKAINEQNPDKAWTLISEKSKESFEKLGSNKNKSGKDAFLETVKSESLGVLSGAYNIIDEKQSGDSAIVIIQLAAGDTRELYSVKEGGTWRFDFERSLQQSLEQVE